MCALTTVGQIGCRFVLLSILACIATVAAAQTLDEARSLHRAGRLVEALAAYRHVAQEVATTDRVSAGTARNNACVILMNTGDNPAALEECLEALRLRREIGDRGREARTLNNLALVLQHLARFGESEQHFHEALSANREVGDARSEVINYANLGVLATWAGWYSKALDYLGRAHALSRQHGDTEWAAEQTRLALINRAVVLERLGAYREALGTYREVMSYKEEMSPYRQAGLQVNLGVVYRNLGDPVRAIAAFEDAIETYRRLGDRSALSNACLNVGIVRHLNLAQPFSAEKAYREALRIAEEAGDRAEELQGLYYLGRLLLDLDQTEEAESVFRRCLRVAEESNSVEGRWESEAGLARVFRSRGDLQGALTSLLSAIDEIEHVRKSLGPSSLRSHYFGDKRAVYVAAVQVLADLERSEPGRGYAEQAYDVVQRAKARALLDALGPGEKHGTPLGAAQIADHVGSGTLLEYFVGETDLFVWRIHDGRVEMDSLGDPRSIQDDVTTVHRALERGVEPPAEVLESLSERLLRGTGSLLAEATEVRIAAGGRLHHLPFSLLTVPGSGGRRLVDVATVSYLPSGSALAWLHREPRSQDLALIGFGDPVLEGRSEHGTPAGLLISRFELGPLPHAYEELAAIRRWVSGDSVVRTGSQATEEGFAEAVRQGARIVHLVSHTVVDEGREHGAAILLTPGEQSDGLLRPEEIAALDYPVDLTVLAACRTALGAAQDGNALATLTGAFLAAGSSAVVATLWDVGDAETRVFMEQFYFQLQRGLDPAHALRMAKLRLIDDSRWNRAGLWAAYVLVGDARPLAGGSGRIVALWAWVPILLLALIGGLLARRLRRARKPTGL